MVSVFRGPQVAFYDDDADAVDGDADVPHDDTDDPSFAVTSWFPDPANIEPRRHGGWRGQPQGRDQRGDLLQLAQEVRRVDAVRDETAAPARGGEWQAEEDRGRPVARQGDAAGRDPPKVLKPARQRQMVDYARSTWRVSIRRACRALPVERSTYHYRSRRAGQAQLTERIKEIAATRVRYGFGAFMCCGAGTAGE